MSQKFAFIAPEGANKRRESRGETGVKRVGTIVTNDGTDSPPPAPFKFGAPSPDVWNNEDSAEYAAGQTRPDLGDVAHQVHAVHKAGQEFKRRRSVRLASLVVEDAKTLFNPNEALMEKLESPDLNKEIKVVGVAMEITSNIGTRIMETLLPYVRERELRVIRVIDPKERVTKVELEHELISKCHPICSKHNIIKEIQCVVRQVQKEDEVPNEIVRAAEQSKSDMIFIGTNKFGYHPGHTCEIVMRYVFVPVFVTRPHGQPFKTSAKFMVNLDGTLISLLALKFTRPEGQQVSLGENMANIAFDIDADTLVIGSENKGQHELGSVEGYLIYHAKCNVLVYKNQWSLDNHRGSFSGSTSVGDRSGSVISLTGNTESGVFNMRRHSSAV
eukprot:CAMPEP_0174327052 /NCGR_PEP_ID=MMETSP0810-20121108/14287_1 /TAXON_ID=73025 ORGANISM="Eutreptiella gymnastica-like, Strain CCMP1594" /NCGR_SAMPLE_ID=MMETSP0810 /ASSEMBLY_ACC=CAM_ASM_000659 /LENGTH=386 /DNA_ID=CAMNT_0015440825 /DNA_START=52 /DNA_END=1213 /DNA_ORIENTATION=+